MLQILLLQKFHKCLGAKGVTLRADGKRIFFIKFLCSIKSLDFLTLPVVTKSRKITSFAWKAFIKKQREQFRRKVLPAFFEFKKKILQRYCD